MKKFLSLALFAAFVLLAIPAFADDNPTGGQAGQDLSNANQDSTAAAAAPSDDQAKWQAGQTFDSPHQ